MESSEVKAEHDRLIEDLKSRDPNNPSALDDFLRQHSTLIPETYQLSREVQYRQVTLFKQVDQELLDHNALLKKSYLCAYQHTNYLYLWRYFIRCIFEVTIEILIFLIELSKFY